eukprot:c43690_g1_i1 orf=54-230(+)
MITLLVMKDHPTHAHWTLGLEVPSYTFLHTEAHASHSGTHSSLTDPMDGYSYTLIYPL